MMRSLVIVVALVIIQNANSTPQFFGQSNASESNGKVVSRSIASGSIGFNRIPEIHNDLLPPLLPGEIAEFSFSRDSLSNTIPVLSLEVEPPPLPKSILSTLPKTTTQTPTTTRIAPVQRPQTNKFQQNSVFSQNLNSDNNNGASKKFGNNGSYKFKGDDGSYKPKGNLGYYTHNNAGAYKHDDRGKYRKN